MTSHTSSSRPARAQRCELAVPASNPKFFAKAAAADVDALFLDLEDAVAPQQKETARRQAIEALNGIDWGKKTVAVRINDLSTPWALDDLLDISRQAPRLDLILLPKASSPFDVQFVDQILTMVERQSGRDKRIGIEVLIEGAKGVANVEAIAQASPRLEAMIFGVGDYTVDMQTYDKVFGKPSARYAVAGAPGADGSTPMHWNDQWHFALARVANACRAWGLRPIDGPYTDFKDKDGYIACAQRASALGFEGKWAIHPSQIELANQVFSPTAQEVEWAQSTVRLLDETNRAGQGAVGHEGVLVDMAHLKLAQSIERRQALIAAHRKA